MPFETEFIKSRLLADGALAGLNEEARHVLYVVMETGLRPSEVVNLQRNTIVPVANSTRLTIACESVDNPRHGRSLQAGLVCRDWTVPVASCAASRDPCASAPAQCPAA